VNDDIGYTLPGEALLHFRHLTAYNLELDFAAADSYTGFTAVPTLTNLVVRQRVIALDIDTAFILNLTTLKNLQLRISTVLSHQFFSALRSLNSLAVYKAVFNYDHLGLLTNLTELHISQMNDAPKILHLPTSLQELSFEGLDLSNVPRNQLPNLYKYTFC
jgi:hypothetical protein